MTCWTGTGDNQLYERKSEKYMFIEYVESSFYTFKLFITFQAYLVLSNLFLMKDLCE